MFNRSLIDLEFRMRAFAEPLFFQRDFGDVKMLDQITYGILYPGLGDLWVGISHLVQASRKNNHPIRLSLLRANADENCEESLFHREDLARRILALFKADESAKIVREVAVKHLPVHPPRNGSVIPIPQYKEHKRAGFTYQIEGVSRPDLNPSASEIELFYSKSAFEKGKKVGLPMTLEESVKAIGAASFFVGVSSGMSHIAASLGVPTIIYFKFAADDQENIKNYRHLKRWHPYAGVSFFSTKYELEKHLCKHSKC